MHVFLANMLVGDEPHHFGVCIIAQYDNTLG